MKDQLLAMQMRAFPDSYELLDVEMFEALERVVPDWMAKHKMEDWPMYDARHEFGDWYAPIFYLEWKRQQIEQTRARWARSAFRCRSEWPMGFFYACGKQDDGTYRHVGFRYGAGHESEYMSGFDGMTYTPTKETSK